MHPEAPEQFTLAWRGDRAGQRVAGAGHAGPGGPVGVRFQRIRRAAGHRTVVGGQRRSHGGRSRTGQRGAAGRHGVGSARPYPGRLARWGTGRVLVAGLLLLGAPAPAYLLSDGLGWVLALSAVRGLGFGILTVVGSTVVAHCARPAVGVPRSACTGWRWRCPTWCCCPGRCRSWIGGGSDRSSGWRRSRCWGCRPRSGWRGCCRTGRPGPDRPTSRRAVLRAGLPALRGIVAPTVVLFSVTMAGGAVLTFAPQLTDSDTAALVLLIMGLTAALVALAGRLAGGPARRLALPGPRPGRCRGGHGVVRVGGGPGARRVLIAAAIVFGLGYGALQNLTLVAAFAAVRAGAAAGGERRLEHRLRRRDRVRRRPGRGRRHGVLLPRVPRHFDDV